MLYSFFWATGTISIYILFIKRLELTFVGTRHAIPNYVYYGLYFGCALFQAQWISFAVVYYLNLTNIITTAQFELGAAINSTVGQIVDFALSVSIIVIFIRKLRDLSIEVRANGSDQLLNSHKLTQSQLKIVSSMSKVTILSIVCIVSTQCLFMFSGIMFWMKMLTWEDIETMLLVLDAIINSICVVLNFDFASIWYRRMCCCCDYCCGKLCAYHTEQKWNQYKESLLPQGFEL